MTQHVPFSSVPEERWSEIRDFPGYFVSDWGRILNQSTGVYLKASPNTRSLYIVGLMRNAVQYKRSLPLLVATEYVRPMRRDFDTPINLNGERADCHYQNLMWRPLWFARKYTRQFYDDHPTFERPIEDVETGEIYKSSMHAAMVNGLLDVQIYESMVNNTYVPPTGQIFREAIDR